MQARLHMSNFRPVELTEYIKIGHNIINANGDVVRTLPTHASSGFMAATKVDSAVGSTQFIDTDNLTFLVAETLAAAGQVIVFCAMKYQCEQTCAMLAALLGPKLTEVSGRPFETPPEMLARRAALASKHPRFAPLLTCGVAYHHAGLTDDERCDIEAAYCAGVILVLAATQTLSAGINLPARRVIFRSPYVGKQFLDVAKYRSVARVYVAGPSSQSSVLLLCRQMAGRAGRKGLDSSGDSILMCYQKDLQKCRELLNAKLPPLQSALLPPSSQTIDRGLIEAGSVRGLSRLMLEFVASKLARSSDDVLAAMQFTLLHALVCILLSSHAL